MRHAMEASPLPRKRMSTLITNAHPLVLSSQEVTLGMSTTDHLPSAHGAEQKAVSAANKDADPISISRSSRMVV
jgi:hypothetical protein